MVFSVKASHLMADFAGNVEAQIDWNAGFIRLGAPARFRQIMARGLGWR